MCNFFPQNATRALLHAKTGFAYCPSGNVTGKMTVETTRMRWAVVRPADMRTGAMHPDHFVLFFSLTCFLFEGCGAGQFQCNNKKCVSEKNRCDAKDNCGDGSDELNCPGGKFLTLYLSVSRVPISKELWFGKTCVQKLMGGKKKEVSFAGLSSSPSVRSSVIWE